MSQNQLLEGLVWYVVFVYSAVCHEAGHAWSSYKLGDSTAYEGGQVSLDPTPHVRREPFGMVVVPLISILLSGFPMGWASAPYDPHWAAQYPRRAAWMALAGPATNLILAVLALLALRIGLTTGFFQYAGIVRCAQLVAGHGSAFSDIAAVLVSVVFSTNLLLFAFNLLPLPPLDGSCLPLLVLDEHASHKYQELLYNPTLRFVGLIVAFKGFGLIFPVILVQVLKWSLPGLL